VCAALWPERCNGLVSLNGYNIQGIANSGKPAKAEDEAALWYQWYFQIERGRAGPIANSHSLPQEEPEAFAQAIVDVMRR
jgi:hypothetical protein